MRRVAVICLALAGCAGVLAGCGSEGVVTPTPETVIGSLPKPAQDPLTPAFALKGDPVAGKKIFLTSGCTGCHTLADAGRDRHGRAEPRPGEAELPARHGARDARQERDAVVQGAADPAADR